MTRDTRHVTRDLNMGGAGLVLILLCCTLAVGAVDVEYSGAGHSNIACLKIL